MISTRLAHAACTFVLGATGWAAEVSSDFENGSTGRIEKVSDVHFRIGVKGESDQNKRNRQGSWYHFQVDGATRKPMMLDIVDLRGEYNFQANRGAITGATPPLFSYDRKNWTHVTDFEYDKSEPMLRLRVTPTASRFWIAHTPPYTNRHLAALRNFVRSTKAAHEEIIGKAAGGRDLYLWTIGPGTPRPSRKVVWLMFRQHSWESGSSWVGEAVVRTLLANDESGQRLRDAAIWKIYPMCDPDGVARGGVRFNINGYDLNRNWDAIDPVLMPEIAAQYNGISKWLKAGGRIDLFLTLHNTETAEYLEGPQGGANEPAMQHISERFFAALQNTTFDPNRPLHYSAATTTAGMKGRMTANQALKRDFGIPAFLMEQRIARGPKLGRLPVIADRLAFGRELVGAIAAALKEAK